MSLKGKTIHSKERMIVHKVTDFCEREANAQKLLLPLCQAQKRAAAATGVSLRTIKRIKKQTLADPEKLSIPGMHSKSPTERNAESPVVKMEVTPSLPQPPTICSLNEGHEVKMEKPSPPNQPTTSQSFVESPVITTQDSPVSSLPSNTVVIIQNPTTVVTSSHNNAYDLCIVGAGMFGSAAARHASANVGLKICLVGPEEPSPREMSNREIFGAYYDESRIVSTLDSDVPTEILTKNSIKRFRELEHLSGIDFYYPVGFLWISKTNSPLSKKVMQAADSLNLPIVDLSYNDIFERRFPYIKLKSDDHPLLDDFGAGYINPRNIVAAQKIVAKNQGCDIVNDVVQEVKPLVNGVHEIITENQGTIIAKRVLICTGAFTNFKAFPMQKLQMTIQKETAALLHITFKEARRLSAMPSLVYWRPEDKLGAYILPPVLYPDGYHYLKIGHTEFQEEAHQVTSLEEIKSWYLFKGDPEKIACLSKLLVDLLPDLKYEGITEKTCVSSNSASELPYIDRVSSTVTVAAVGNGRGAQYSDEVGRIAAALSLTGKWESEIPKSHFQVMYQS